MRKRVMLALGALAFIGFLVLALTRPGAAVVGATPGIMAAATAAHDAPDIERLPAPTTIDTYAFLKVTSPRVDLSRLIQWTPPGETAPGRFEHVYLLQHPGVDIELRGKKVLVTIRTPGFVRVREAR